MARLGLKPGVRPTGMEFGVRNSIKHLRLASLCLVGLGMAVPAAAQDTPHVELSGGYQWLDAKKGDVSSSYPLGWYADAAYNWNRLIGIVAQAGGGYDRRESAFANEGVTFTTTGDLSVHNFMGGVRLNGRQSARQVWFGQALAGGVRVSLNATGTATGRGTTLSQNWSQSRTYSGLQFGGGVNWALSPRVGIRVGADVLRILHPGEGDRTIPFFVGDGTNVYRFAAGIVLLFCRQ